MPCAWFPPRRFAGRSFHVLLAVLALVAIGCSRPSIPPTADAANARSGAAHEQAKPESATSTAVLQPSSDAVPIEAGDTVWGAPDAPVTLVEFTDVQCPFCARVVGTLEALKQRYGSAQLRAVRKHNPLPFHPQARAAAQLAQAVQQAAGSARSWAFVDLALQRQSQLPQTPYAAWLKELGLDPAPLLALSTSPDVVAKVERDMALAARLGERGTPAFVINGVHLSGAQPLERFVSIIDAELQATAALRAEKVPAVNLYAERVRVNQTLSARTAQASEVPEDLALYQVPVAGAPVLGPADALVTIVEFVDFECPFCRRADATLSQLLAKYPTEVRWVVRHNPLAFHARALPAARLSVEARAQRGNTAFFEVAALLLKSEALEAADLERIAIAAKLDWPRARAAIASTRHDATIERDQRLAFRLRAAGTPVFFINGMRLSGAQPLERFVALVEDRLGVARARVLGGVPPARVYDDILRVATAPPALPKVVLAPPAPDAPAFGPPRAPVLIQVFSDLECPFCARGDDTLQRLVSRHPGQIRVIFRHLPLPFHPQARRAARMTLAAQRLLGNRAFFALTARFFRDQAQADAFAAARVQGYASELKLPFQTLWDAADDVSGDARIDADVRAAHAAGIDGTPSFVINGQLLSGAQPLIAFEAAFEAARSAGSPRASSSAPP